MLAPKLRFPEFRTQWVTQRLDVIAQPITEQAGNRPITPYTVSTGVGLVSQQDRFGRTIAGSAFKNYYVLRNQDFAYNKSATKAYPQGYIARFLGEEGAVPNSIFTCFRVDPNLVDPAYLDYLFAGNLHGRWLRRFIEVSARAHGSLSVDDAELMSLPVPFPAGASSSAEQRKIAECLTSLDEWIAAERQKLDALQGHRRGLMQQLFPHEGETSPCLRFPEFRTGADWERKRLGELNPFITSGSRGWAEHYADHGSLFVRITNLSRESIFLDLTDSQFVSLPPEAREGVRTQVKAHDVLISITADIGIIGYVDAGVPSPAYINQHIALVRFETPSVSSMFVAYFLASHESQRLFRASTDNGTKAGMNLTAVQNMQLALPCPAEQERIAACLSSLDARIAAQSRKLDALRTHKKGLMQQLFPSPEGV